MSEVRRSCLSVTVATRRPTIKDVAQAAGVSRTTVSHALSGRRTVNAETVKRVRAAAEQLDYEPRRTASSLRSGRIGTIGLLSPAVGDRPPHEELLGLDFYMRLAAEVAKRAFEHGQTVQLLPYTRDSSRLRHVELDGALVSDPTRADPVLAVLREREVPIVTLEQDPDHPDDPWQVRADHALGAAMILDHFIAHGAARPALLIPEVDWAWPAQVRDGWERACAERGRPVRVELVRSSGGGRGAAAAASRLLRGRARPDAVFALTDHYGPAVLAAAAQLELAVPDDVLVAAGTESPQALATDPQLTTLAHTPEVQGEAAVDLLLHQIEGGAGSPVVTEPLLVVRGSTLRRR